MLSGSVRRAGGVLLALSVGLLAAGSAAGAQSTAGEAGTDPPQAAAQVLPVLDPAQAPGFDPRAVETAVTGLLADGALGPAPGIAILDGASGQVVMDRAGSAPLAPASSLKIATGTAALVALGPQARLATRVVRETDGTLVLVGAGDPTLLPAPHDTPELAGAANLADLASQTAAALHATGQTKAVLRYDASLFTGPALNPDWDPSFVAQGIVSPVSALTLDRLTPGVDSAALDADPAGTTAKAFMHALAADGVSVTQIAAGKATADAAPVATVQSPPLVTIVDRMLDISDNDVAEALFRLSAIADGLPATFAGGSQAVTKTLAGLGVPSAHLAIKDGSGLSRNNRVTALTLASLLTAEAQDEAKDANISWLPPGLPVGGLTGSLAGRFDDPATEAGAGRVHAKTGTLTGVTSLTGLVTTEQGRPLAFSVITNGSTSTDAAREDLDRIAAALAACGCEAATP